MNTLIDVTGKLPHGLVEMYQKVDICAKDLGIDYLIVGAMARDLVMHHGFGAHIERGTRDVDFAIQVASWQEFNTLKEASIQYSLLPMIARAEPRRQAPVVSGPYAHSKLPIYRVSAPFRF